MSTPEQQKYATLTNTVRKDSANEEVIVEINERAYPSEWYQALYEIFSQQPPLGSSFCNSNGQWAHLDFMCPSQKGGRLVIKIEHDWYKNPHPIEVTLTHDPTTDFAGLSRSKRTSFVFDQETMQQVTFAFSALRYNSTQQVVAFYTEDDLTRDEPTLILTPTSVASQREEW